MCGRFALSATESDLKEHFELSRACVMRSRYNIAPDQMIPVIRGPNFHIDFLKWGLIPTWNAAQAKLNTLGYINARAETLFEKPTFKRLALRQRCVIPATGYYEWMQIKDKKQPYYIQLKVETHQTALLGMAGIWERWQDENGNQVDTCSIITVSAHSSLSFISDRMPLILSKQDYKVWLAEKSTQAQLQSILEDHSLNNIVYQAYPVSHKINDPRFDTPLCLHSL